jgi:hypothetical protein
VRETGFAKWAAFEKAKIAPALSGQEAAAIVIGDGSYNLSIIARVTAARLFVAPLGQD